MTRHILPLLFLFVVLFSCAKEDPEGPVVDPPPPASPVVLDLAQVPYDSLSTYNFFSGDMAALQPVYGVLPYAPINALFSDYAHKERFVWMPSGAQATYAGDSAVLNFPEGAVLIKNFYYDQVQPQNTRRILETRLLIRRNGEWLLAEYIWNAAQTEAILTTNGVNETISFVDDNGVLRTVDYRYPSPAECHTCHKDGDANIPIGPKPQNLNSDLAYSNGTWNQLEQWMGAGYLANSLPASINTTARWDDPAQSLTDRVRGYVDMNCAHCHANGKYCDYRPMRFAWSETDDLANLGVCVAPADPLLPVHSHIVKPGNTEKSLLFYRISSVQDGVRMPLLGRTLVHEEGRQLIEQWINSLTTTCN
jgi:uncharacterized repeat protein (TIGR03806 family)